jgi:plastocyanin
MRKRERAMTLAAVTMAVLGWGLVEPVSALKSTAPAGETGRSAGAVTIGDDFFSPRSLTVTPGTSVTWTNQGEDVHTTTSTRGLWDRQLAPGRSFTRVFNRQGTFRYFCRFHDDMTGVIRVSA